MMGTEISKSPLVDNSGVPTLGAATLTMGGLCPCCKEPVAAIELVPDATETRTDMRLWYRSHRYMIKRKGGDKFCRNVQRVNESNSMM